jgi:hypothetical protein
MSKSFPLSKYATLQDLYKAKAEYYEELFNRCADRLVELEELYYSDEDRAYYCTCSGEPIDEGI